MLLIWLSLLQVQGAITLGLNDAVEVHIKRYVEELRISPKPFILNGTPLEFPDGAGGSVFYSHKLVDRLVLDKGRIMNDDLSRSELAYCLRSPYSGVRWLAYALIKRFDGSLFVRQSVFCPLVSVAESDQNRRFVELLEHQYSMQEAARIFSSKILQCF